MIALLKFNLNDTSLRLVPIRVDCKILSVDALEFAFLCFHVSEIVSEDRVRLGDFV